MMKDKLVKTGHKKAYHRFFRGLRFMGAFAGLLAVSAIPVLVSFTSVTQTKAKMVDENTSSVPEETPIDSIDVSEAPIEE
ncbi:MAG: hypothetical protein J6328_07235 [Bacilli bacterium]|nr:hypothetical protein [Bacilli bacterium]